MSNETTSGRLAAITLTRAVAFDPLRVIEEATAQAAAERIAREHADPEDPHALSHRFEKDASQAGDFIDLIIEGTDHARLEIVKARLEARGYEISMSYRACEPQDLVEITDPEDGCPADDDRARRVLAYFDYHGPIEQGPRPGLYRVDLNKGSFPENSFLDEVVMLDGGDYAIAAAQDEGQQ